MGREVSFDSLLKIHRRTHIDLIGDFVPEAVNSSGTPEAGGKGILSVDRS